MSELRDRARQAAREYYTYRALDQCVEWISADGVRKFGLCTGIYPVSGIAKVSTQQWGIQFVRIALLAPWFGRWSA